GAHDLLALLAHALRHDDRAAVPLDRRHERTGDAGVASRALQHAHAGLEIAARLCPLEHPEVDAILEAATRTVPFDLEVHGGTDAGRHAIELYERRAPHGGGDRQQGVAIRVPQDRHEDRDCTLVRWGPRDGPQAPRRSSRPGGAVPLLYHGREMAPKPPSVRRGPAEPCRSSLTRWGPRDGPQAPKRSSRPGGAVPLLYHGREMAPKPPSVRRGPAESRGAPLSRDRQGFTEL